MTWCDRARLDKHPCLRYMFVSHVSSTFWASSCSAPSSKTSASVQYFPAFLDDLFSTKINGALNPRKRNQLETQKGKTPGRARRSGGQPGDCIIGWPAHRHLFCNKHQNLKSHFHRDPFIRLAISGMRMKGIRSNNARRITSRPCWPRVL